MCQPYIESATALSDTTTFSVSKKDIYLINRVILEEQTYNVN